MNLQSFDLVNDILSYATTLLPAKPVASLPESSDGASPVASPVISPVMAPFLTPSSSTCLLQIPLHLLLSLLLHPRLCILAGGRWAIRSDSAAEIS